MKLNSVQAAKAYDSVRDTFSKICVPTEEQAKAYIAMLSSTASLKGDVAAGSIFDFSLAAEAARELARRNSTKATVAWQCVLKVRIRFASFFLRVSSPCLADIALLSTSQRGNGSGMRKFQKGSGSDGLNEPAAC